MDCPSSAHIPPTQHSMLRQYFAWSAAFGLSGILFSIILRLAALEGVPLFFAIAIELPIRALSRVLEWVPGLIRAAHFIALYPAVTIISFGILGIVFCAFWRMLKLQWSSTKYIILEASALMIGLDLWGASCARPICERGYSLDENARLFLASGIAIIVATVISLLLVATRPRFHKDPT